jgi:outer membrane lipoprotein-sorting protein
VRLQRSLFLSGSTTALALLSTTSAFADAQGDRILRQAFKTLYDAKSMTARITVELAQPGGATWRYRGALAAMKSNYLRVDMKMIAPNPNVPIMNYADGKNYFVLVNRGKQYVKSPLPPNPTEFNGMWEGEIDSFFGGEKRADNLKTTYMGTETVNDVTCDIVRATDGDRYYTYFIGQQDHLIYRSTFDVGSKEQPATQTNTLSRIKLNVALTAADFKFTPPKDAHLYEEPDFDQLLIPTL